MAGFVNFGDEKYANVTMAVGSKEVGTRLPASNQTTDMMLVYFLMYKISWAKKTSVWETIIPFFKVSPKEVKWLDTGIEKNLSNAIKAYQTYRKNKGFPIFPDGRVDSIPSGRSLSPGSMGIRTTITHTIYTIGVLNNQFIYSIKPSSQTADFTIDVALKSVANDMPDKLFNELFPA